MPSRAGGRPSSCQPIKTEPPGAPGTSDRFSTTQGDQPASPQQEQKPCRRQRNRCWRWGRVPSTTGAARRAPTRAWGKDRRARASPPTRRGPGSTTRWQAACQRGIKDRDLRAAAFFSWQGIADLQPVARAPDLRDVAQLLGRPPMHPVTLFSASGRFPSAA